MPLFSNLLDFIQHRIRMSHLYQPVMLTTLLRNDGAASVRQIAQQFAQRVSRRLQCDVIPVAGDAISFYVADRSSSGLSAPARQATVDKAQREYLAARR